MSNDTSSAGRGPGRDGSKEKFWRRTLRQFAAGGQSVRGFCAKRGLSEPSFYAWRRTLAERDATAPQPAPAFLPIRLTDAAGTMEIVLPGGHRIRLRGPVDPAALAGILAALRTTGMGEA